MGIYVRDNHTRGPLANMKLPHQTQLHQFLSRASLRVAMAHIPAGRFVHWARGFLLAIAGHSGTRVGEFLASSRKVVFLVSDHGGWR